MMKKNKYIVLLALILCSVVLIGCSDKAMTFSLQEESAVNDRTMEQANTDNEVAGQMDMVTPETAKAKSDSKAAGQSRGSVRKDAVMEAQSLESVYVHVCGAVISPGVVEVAVDSRVEDALLAAGGFREDAAIDYVNLAAKVEDGQQVYFPTREEAEALTAENGGLIASGTESNLQQTTSEQSVKVNINTAEVELLCTLPGIGEARAQAIIDYREANGDFQNVEGIMQVPGIKQNAYEKLRDKITVN